MRHYLDKKPANSIRKASIENSFNTATSYYFRIAPESNLKNVIQQIRDFAHEIGYHYEDIPLENGDFVNARNSIKKSGILQPVLTCQNNLYAWLSAL